MPSVTEVRIPREAIPVLGRVVDLDQDHADGLVESLSTGDVRDLAALKAAVRDAVGDVWSEPDVNSFVGHLMSMLALGGTHNFEVNDLAAIITRKAAPSLDQDDAEHVLSTRLSALLGAEDLVAYGKASDIVTEYDRLLHLSRVITDIRPVFGPDAKDDPMGAVVVSSLRIDYFEGNRIKSMTFAMDAEDLADLKKTIDRATEKHHTLSRTLQRAGLPEFDITMGDDE